MGRGLTSHNASAVVIKKQRVYYITYNQSSLGVLVYIILEYYRVFIRNDQKVYGVYRSRIPSTTTVLHYIAFGFDNVVDEFI
jgi:hypothetical protein